MVFFNYATMQMAAKIVYYGPGLCGKTTNLHHIYAKTSPQSRGEMVSLETETDRTLFFDLLPIDVGVIGGFKTRLQLYTIPGQVFYNTTRKLVLKGVDGLVFVADSQAAAVDGNIDSFKNLRENLAEIGLNLDEIPLVLQLNKRDLPNIVSVDTLLDAVDPERKFEYVEAVASAGTGVFETLKLISKLTLRTLRRRMTGEEPIKATARRPFSEVAQFRVKETAEAPAVPTPMPAPAPSAAPSAPAAVAAQAVSAPAAVQEAVEEIAAAAAEAAPPAEVEAIAPKPSAPAHEPEINFNQTEREAPVEQVKTVKVRSTIDVLAELEALRKRSTAGPRSRKEPPSAPARLGRELHKAVNFNVAPDVLARTRSVKVTLSFQGDDNAVVHNVDETVQLEADDVESLSVNLRVDQT